MADIETLLEQIEHAIYGKDVRQAIVDAIRQCYEDANISIKDEIKQALLALADSVIYVDDDGSDVRQALYDALYTVDVVSITASFVQGSAIIYDTDSLDDLKPYLTVTAYYDNGTHSEVSTYTLSGTLTAGTSTITVTYNEKTTTFNVTVSAGLPSGYTQYDYIQVANRADGSTTVNVAVPESWITLGTYTNLDDLNFDLKFAAMTGYTRGSCLIGCRMDSTTASGNAVYIGSASSSAIGASDRSRVFARGSALTYSSEAITMNTKTSVIFENTASSPSYFTFGGGSRTTLTWGTLTTVTKGFTLFTNPTPSATSMTLQRYLQCGRLILTNMQGTTVGDYIPVVRTSDNVIGMYDLIGQNFYTSSTASYATVGNSNCYYTVGNWS